MRSSATRITLLREQAIRMPLTAKGGIDNRECASTACGSRSVGGSIQQRQRWWE
jgi:hypothetical protein